MTFKLLILCRVEIWIGAGLLAILGVLQKLCRVAFLLSRTESCAFVFVHVQTDTHAWMLHSRSFIGLIWT